MRSDRLVDGALNGGFLLRKGAAVATAVVITFVGCAGEKVEVVEGQPCATPGVDLVAYFKKGVTDEQISDFAESLNEFGKNNEIPEHVRIVSNSHADYEARALEFNFCERTSAAAIRRFRDKLVDSKLTRRLAPSSLEGGLSNEG